MASVKQSKKTQAQTNLEFALGKIRVEFGELSEAEQDQFLKLVLDEVDLRELRGFKSLRELLPFSPNSFIYGQESRHTLSIEILEMGEKVTFSSEGFQDNPVSMDTHVVSLIRGRWFREVATFRRNESGEETDDYDVASSWGKSGYLYKGYCDVLVLCRPRNHTRAYRNLAGVRFWYEKVPLERRYKIVKILVEELPLERLWQYLGDLYARVVVDLIRELKSAHQRTADELESKYKRMRIKVARLERISEAISG